MGRIEGIAEDRQSGAAEIARAAAGAIADLSPDSVRAAVEALLRGHPSMAPLWRLASEVMAGPDPSMAAERFLGHLDADGRTSVRLAEILPDRVITMSYSSTLIEALRIRRPAQVVCMRSDPGGEGARLAEAVRDGAAIVKVLDDSEVLRDLPGDAAVTGADAVSPLGVINKVKTRALAEACRAWGIACYAAAGLTKFVAKRLPVVELFEETPLAVFAAVVTPMGPLSAHVARSYAAQSVLHPDLNPLFRSLSA